MMSKRVALKHLCFWDKNLPCGPVRTFLKSVSTSCIYNLTVVHAFPGTVPSWYIYRRKTFLQDFFLAKCTNDSHDTGHGWPDGDQGGFSAGEWPRSESKKLTEELGAGAAHFQATSSWKPWNLCLEQEVAFFVLLSRLDGEMSSPGLNASGGIGSFPSNWLILSHAKVQEENTFSWERMMSVGSQVTCVLDNTDELLRKSNFSPTYEFSFVTFLSLHFNISCGDVPPWPCGSLNKNMAAFCPYPKSAWG